MQKTSIGRALKREEMTIDIDKIEFTINALKRRNKETKKTLIHSQS